MSPSAAGPTSRTTQERQLLLDLITATGEAQNQASTLSVALRLICRYAGWNLGEAWIPATSGTSLHRVAAVYSATLNRDTDTLTDVSADSATSLGPEIPAQVFTARQAAWLSDLSLNSPDPRRKFHTVFATPVPDGAMRAILVFAKFRKQPEDAHFVALIGTIDKQIGTVLALQQGEVQRQNSEARLANLVGLASDAIVSMNQQRRIILFSPGAEQIFGFTAEEMLGQTMDAIVPTRLLPHHGEQFNHYDADPQANDRSNKVETVGRRKNGEEFPVEMAYSKQVLNGETVYTAIVHDTSRRQDDARRLQIYSELLVNAHDAIGLTDLNACLTYVNPAFAQMTGYSEEEMIGMPVMNILDSSTSINDIVAQVMTCDAYRSEIPLVRKDGSIFYGNINAFTIKNAKGEVAGIGGIVRDVTEAKLAAERAHQSELLYRALARNIPNFAVLIYDRDLRFILADGGALEVQGYQKEYVEGKTLSEVLPSELSEPLTPFYRMALEGQTMQLDFDLNGYTYDVRFVPLVEEDGGIMHAMAVTSDITASKKAENEIRSLNQNLERRVTQRTAELVAANKELEAFSYSVSHDLRAPLRSISGFTKFLDEEYAHLLPDEAREYIEIVRQTTREMGDLISALLSFSRLTRKELATTMVDMKELVYEVLDELEPEMQGRSIEINVGKLPRSYADRTLVKQVFTNLLSNAVKYTRAKPVAHIEVGSHWQDGNRVYFVQDNGAGFDMRFAHKLFGVFQRLHKAEDYEGTGVGLAIVQRIIHRHGGQVWTQAEVDQGATFFFTISLGEKDEY